VIEVAAAAATPIFHLRSRLHYFFYQSPIDQTVVVEVMNHFPGGDFRSAATKGVLEEYNRRLIEKCFISQEKLPLENWLTRSSRSSLHLKEVLFDIEG